VGGVTEFASVTERIDRGSPMWYADTVGLHLKRLTEEGKTFAELNREQAVMA